MPVVLQKRLILLRINGLYMATSPYRGHGSISAARAISNLISLAASMAGGRFLRSCPYVRQELQIIPGSRNCEQNKNGGSPDYNSQPGVQRGHIRFASSTDSSRRGGGCRGAGWLGGECAPGAIEYASFDGALLDANLRGEPLTLRELSPYCAAAAGLPVPNTMTFAPIGVRL